MIEPVCFAHHLAYTFLDDIEVQHDIVDVDAALVPE